MILLFALVSRRFENSVLAPPLLFTVFGLAAGGHGLGIIHLNIGDHTLYLIAEITLVLILFGDASRIDLRSLKRELGLPVRLLLVGMPLTIAFGGLLAFGLLPGLLFWEAILIGAILAPTDAALGQAVVSSKSVPQRIRQALNVESGLNDGIAVPIVLVVLCAAGSQVREGLSSLDWLVFAVKQVGLGPVAGIGVGGVGALLFIQAKKREWLNESLERVVGLALAILAFTVAEQIGGNGFIAAFTAGLTLGHFGRDVCSPLYEFLEAEGQLLMLVVFLLLGVAMAAPALSMATPAVFLYAALSLTAVRMIPVGLSMLGARMKLPTVVFLGWFGPRGLASILFVLVVVEDGMVKNGGTIVTVVITTVLMSIAAHGITAAPAAKKFGELVAANRESCDEELKPVHEHPLR